MKLQFKVFGVEVLSLELDQLHQQADVVEAVVAEVEKHGAKVLNKGIKGMSRFWVQRMMSKA